MAREAASQALGTARVYWNGAHATQTVGGKPFISPLGGKLHSEVRQHNASTAAAASAAARVGCCCRLPPVAPLVVQPLNAGSPESHHDAPSLPANHRAWRCCGRTAGSACLRPTLAPLPLPSPPGRVRRLRVGWHLIHILVPSCALPAPSQFVCDTACLLPRRRRLPGCRPWAAACAPVPAALHRCAG